VRGKKALLVGLLAMALALTVVSVVACGGGDDGNTASTVDPKVTMQKALDVIETDMTSLMGGVTSGQSKGADLKAALVTAQPHWQAIVDACAGVGADAAKAQQLWDALSTAINGLADDAGMVQMAAVAGPGIAVQTFISDLRKQVGPSAGGAATTTPSS
jgi:hypothetical protein